MMQEAEDTEMEDLEEDRPPAVAARRNRKITKPPKIAKPKQAQPGCPPGDGRSISRLECRE
jgi:hypothetical protein